eukprot:4056704-Alexandrium_andersonii.AAC.1
MQACAHEHQDYPERAAGKLDGARACALTCRWGHGCGVAVLVGVVAVVVAVIAVIAALVVLAALAALAALVALA